MILHEPVAVHIRHLKRFPRPLDIPRVTDNLRIQQNTENFDLFGKCLCGFRKKTHHGTHWYCLFVIQYITFLCIYAAFHGVCDVFQ